MNLDLDKRFILQTISYSFNFRDKKVSEIVEGDNSIYNAGKKLNLLKSYVSSSSIKSQTDLMIPTNLKIINNSKNKSDDFYSEIDAKSHTNSDFIKSMIFFNNILTNLDFIKLKIIKINDENFSETNFDCEILIDDRSEGILFKFDLNIFSKFLQSVNVYANNLSKIEELKKLLEGQKKFLTLKKANSKSRKRIEILISKILNDLFFFDNDLFQIFQLNKIL